MSYWRFTQIVTNINEISANQRGESIIKEGLPQSSKDMIERRKAQR
jgi:hypothetical protein